MKQFNETQMFAMSMTIVAVLVLTGLCFSDMLPGVSEFLRLRRRPPSLEGQILPQTQAAQPAPAGPEPAPTASTTSAALQPVTSTYVVYLAIVLAASAAIVARLGRAES